MIAGIEQVSIPAILIVAISGIAGIVYSDTNDRKDYIETRP